MDFSRRRFIVTGHALVAAAALPFRALGGAANPGSTPFHAVDLRSLTRASFLPLVNSNFAVTSGTSAAAWFTLLSVEDMNPKSAATTTMAVAPKKLKSAAAQTDTYALHFHATGEQLPQGTYKFQHPLLGEFSLFIVPSGTNTYAAIVSHLLNPGRFPVPVKTGPKAGVRAKSGSPSPTL
jgi:hypothetical protein